MKIKNIQPLTLIDYPGILACTIFIFGCNFRCGFCYNSGLVLKEDTPDMEHDKVLEFLQKRRKYLDGVCFTGGEPLMSLDIGFLREVKALGYKIKIDTNGSFPEKLRHLIELNLVDFVSMDIKSSKEKYSELTNVKPNMEKIEESIELISKLSEYEFRTTILEDIHTEEEIKKIAEWLNRIAEKKPKKFVLQGFKVQGKIIDSQFNNYKDTTEECLKKLKKEIETYFEEIEIRV